MEELKKYICTIFADESMEQDEFWKQNNAGHFWEDRKLKLGEQISKSVTTVCILSLLIEIRKSKKTAENASDKWMLNYNSDV